MTNMKTDTDFLVGNLGSIVAVTPISADANKAVDAGLIDYDDWQMVGGSIMVDCRMAGDLLDNLCGTGFSIADE
jgi:hypothetical protein